jgi:hypothetical protein
MKSHHLLDRINFLWILFVVSIFLGLIAKPSFYDQVSFFIKLSISLFMIYKFNDFIQLREITEFDKRICFMAGMNLFLITCSDYVNASLEKIHSIIDKIKKWSGIVYGDD